MRKLVLFAALSLASVASSGNAALVSYGFQLTPTSIEASDPRDQFNSNLAYGAASSGSFTFDTDTNQLLSFNAPLALFADTTGILNDALSANQPCDLQCFIGAVNTGSFYFIDVASITSLTLGAPLGTSFYNDGPNGSGRATTVRGTLQVTGAIPEPDTWALMLLGFGAIGASLRRRKYQVAVALSS